MKFRLVEDIQDNKVTLEVKFEVYGRYGDGGEIITAKVSGKDLRHALMRMVDKMRLYIDSDVIEERNLTAEEIIDSISETNGDGCDMIYLLKNLTTNEVLIDCSDCYIEQDWDDDFDESLKETLDVSLEELQRTADRYLDVEIDSLMRLILRKTDNMTSGQLSRLVKICRKFYATLEEFAYNNIAESFSNNFESRDLQDTGELISALKELIKEYGHMELEKEVYLETVENDHGRQLKIGFNVAESLNEASEDKYVIVHNDCEFYIHEQGKIKFTDELSKATITTNLEGLTKICDWLSDNYHNFSNGKNTFKVEKTSNLKNESLTEAVKTPIVPEPYNKYLEIVPESELDIDWHAKECSYDIAREIAQLAKRALKLPAHEVEMLEHDINNLRSDEWVEQFIQLSDKSRAKELFFKYAVERDEYGAGDKVSGATILGTLGPKNGYEDIFDSWYFLVDDPDFPVVEIVHDRLYPVELPELKEGVFQDSTEKMSEIDKNAREYIFDRLTDYYMHDESEAERRRVTEIIFNKLKASHSEMFDFIQYWGGGEDAADEMEVLGAPEDCRFIIENENFPEPIIYEVITDCGFIIPDDL